MELIAQIRESGKSAAALRKEGLIPAELYGHGLPNVHLSVEAKAFAKALASAGESTVLQVVVGSKKHPALIQDIQHNYLDGSVAHVDFYEVRMDEKIRAHVKIELIGEAPALKEQGVILNQAMEEVEVEALPADLPHSLPVDLSSLVSIGQSLYIKDLSLPKGIKLHVDPETVVVSVNEVKEEVAPVAPVDISEVKVESEEKKLERDKEKAAEADK